MKRCGRLAVAVLLCVTWVSTAAGQTPIGVFGAGGASIPLGDFADAADTGWLVGGGILGMLGTQGVWLGAEGMYGRHRVSDADGVDIEMIGGGGMIGYTFSPAARISPYIFGSAGVLSSKLTADALTGHLSTSLCHLGNIATRLGRSLTFHPETEQIIGDEEANTLVRRQYRDHWGTPRGG